MKKLRFYFTKALLLESIQSFLYKKIQVCRVSRLDYRLFPIKYITKINIAGWNNCVVTKLTNEKFLSTYDFSGFSPL